MGKIKGNPKDSNKIKKFNNNTRKFKGSDNRKHKTQRNRPHKTADDNSKDAKFTENNKKINYVLHPRLLKKKLKDVKESERREKEKSFQLKKRKRNAIYMRTTEKGQPKLNGRMKLLYDQIARSCETT